MLTSKQRAALRSMATSQDTILRIGKGGVTQTVLRQADAALTARELIKFSVLENAPVSIREAADEVAERVTGAIRKNRKLRSDLPAVEQSWKEEGF